MVLLKKLSRHLELRKDGFSTSRRQNTYQKNELRAYELLNRQIEMIACTAHVGILEVVKLEESTEFCFDLVAYQ